MRTFVEPLDVERRGSKVVRVHGWDEGRYISVHSMGAIFLSDVWCREILDEKVIAVVAIRGGRRRGVGSSPRNI